MRWCRLVVVVLCVTACHSGFDRAPAGAGSPAGTFSITERAEPGPITALAVRPPWLWSASAAALRRFDLGSGEVETVGEAPIPILDAVTALAADDEGGGWVATAKQLGRWTPGPGGEL